MHFQADYDNVAALSPQMHANVSRTATPITDDTPHICIADVVLHYYHKRPDLKFDQVMSL